MLKTLVKKQLMEIFRSYFYNAKTNKKRSTARIIAYILLFAALMIGLGGMFTGLSVSLCAPLTQAGMGWLYFALMSLLAIFLGAFGSVFNTYSGLYFAKDNDLLLSLPIPVRTLMASRLLTVYLMGLMYSAVVILPAVIVYWVTVSTAPMVLLGGVLLTALISIFVLTLSCALGWVVAKVSRKLKHKSFITVIVSLAGLAIYYFFVFKAQTAIEQLVANAAVYGEKIKGAAHPALRLWPDRYGRCDSDAAERGGHPRAVCADVDAALAQLFADHDCVGRIGQGCVPRKGRQAPEHRWGTFRQGARALHREPELHAQLRAWHPAAASRGRGAAD